MPTLEERERQVRRRPFGRTICDICLDLAVVAELCTGPFWTELFELMRHVGASVITLMREKSCREQACALQPDRIPGSDWNPHRNVVRQVLGFFIGEDPVDPFAPAAALPTGPPSPPPPKPPLPRKRGRAGRGQLTTG